MTALTILRSYNHHSLDTNMPQKDWFCVLHGYQFCRCARLYMELTDYSEHSNPIDQSSTDHHPRIPQCHDWNCCPSAPSAQVPIHNAAQHNPVWGYNPPDPLNMGIPGDGYTSLHGNSSAFTAGRSSPVQVQTPPSTAGHTSPQGETLYYGSPVQEYTPK
mgnify:CR=1 FL=1